MHNTQHLIVDDEAEVEPLLEVLRLKDEFLRLNPEFLADANAWQELLAPHTTETMAANWESLYGFIDKWGLPWSRHFSSDPTYLFEFPFSGAPLIVGRGSPLEEISRPEEHISILQVDVLAPQDTLEAAFREWLVDRRESVPRESKRRLVWPGRAQGYRQMLEIYRVDLEYADANDPEKLSHMDGVKPDLSNLPGLRAKAKEMILKGGYRGIWPESHADEWFDRRIQSGIPLALPIGVYVRQPSGVTGWTMITLSPSVEIP